MVAKVDTFGEFLRCFFCFVFHERTDLILKGTFFMTSFFDLRRDTKSIVSLEEASMVQSLIHL